MAAFAAGWKPALLTSEPGTEALRAPVDELNYLGYSSGGRGSPASDRIMNLQSLHTNIKSKKNTTRKNQLE
jgi:hypothetical protein